MFRPEGHVPDRVAGDDDEGYKRPAEPGGDVAPDLGDLSEVAQRVHDDADRDEERHIREHLFRDQELRHAERAEQQAGPPGAPPPTDDEFPRHSHDEGRKRLEDEEGVVVALADHERSKPVDQTAEKGGGPMAHALSQHVVHRGR